MNIKVEGIVVSYLTKMICFPDRRIFITPDHNWAFYAWEVARARGWTKPFATLVHVDAHLDDIYDGVEVDGFNDIQTLQDVKVVTERMKIENFIWPAFVRGTIDKIIYVARFPEHDAFDINLLMDPKIVQIVPPGRQYGGMHVQFLEDFKQGYDAKQFDGLLESSAILDLDLDYFNVSDNIFHSRLFPDEEIFRWFVYLRDLRDWDFITVALSSFYCGGDEQCEHILRIFFDVFGLSAKEAEEWP